MQVSRKLSLLTEHHLYLIHGSYRGYAIYGCKCELCVAARPKRTSGLPKRERYTGSQEIIKAYLKDLRTTGESKSECHYNRRCIDCKRKCVPENTFVKRQYVVPVTRTRAGQEMCEECRGTVPYLITIGEPCKGCQKPLRPRRMPADKNRPTVPHGRSGYCRTCIRNGK